MNSNDPQSSMLIQPESFSWLAGNVSGLRPADQWVKIRVPEEMYFDMDQLKAIFVNDQEALFSVSNGEEFIQGKIKDPAIYSIIQSMAYSYKVKITYEPNNQT